MADGAGINFGGNPTHSYVRRMRDCCPRRDVGRHTSVSGEPTGSALLQNTEDSVAPPPPHSVSSLYHSRFTSVSLCITLASADLTGSVRLLAAPLSRSGCSPPACRVALCRCMRAGCITAGGCSQDFVLFQCGPDMGSGRCRVQGGALSLSL